MPDQVASKGVLTWPFPIERPHAGPAMGNGTQGIMVWGAERSLRLTVGRAGFWDHRVGPMSGLPNFETVRRLLEAQDEAGLRAAFGFAEPEPGRPSRPQQLGAGRVVLELPADWRLVAAELDLTQGLCRIRIHDANEAAAELTLRHAVEQPLAWLEIPEDLVGRCTLQVVPAWAHLQSTLAAVGVSAPQSIHKTRGKVRVQGFLQQLPEDDPLALAAAMRQATLTFGTALGPDAADEVAGLVADVDVADQADEASDFWAVYREWGPWVQLPDPVLQELFDYGEYLQAVVTPPQGPACGLQGPLLEDHKLPPWSADYHFNINEQMIYWPALIAGRWSHFEPMWRLIEGWLPQLRERGERFFGRSGALLLPHAVDDRCQVVGEFWTGTIDLACTAWMGQLAYLHHAYSGAIDPLERVAEPLLSGSFEGYWAMSEWVADDAYPGGQRLSLPVSVSPEFKGARMDAWGRDASMQLAAWRMSAELLHRIARVLGQDADPRWQTVLNAVPHYAVAEGHPSAEHEEASDHTIALWQEMPLPESHRHHSHLAGLYPFVTFDPFDEAHREIVRASLGRWIAKGRGKWSGWAHPWAAVLHARVDQAEAAVHTLHRFAECFTNEGRGSVHDADVAGASVIGPPPMREADRWGEKMQLDGALGAVTAVCELLVQCRRDGVHVLPTLPRTWRELAFSGLWAEGGFRIDARVTNRQVVALTVLSTRGGDLTLWADLGPSCTVTSSVRGGLGEHDLSQQPLHVETQPEETLSLKRA